MADAYPDLIAWRKATDLALEICRATQTFPKEATYGLTSQMRRAAVSVASDLAEGKGTLLPQTVCAVSLSPAAFPARTRTPTIRRNATALSRTALLPQNGRPNESVGANPEWTNKKQSGGY
jgi:23S rRNA-intervening sequence protein